MYVLFMSIFCPVSSSLSKLYFDTMRELNLNFLLLHLLFKATSDFYYAYPGKKYDTYQRPRGLNLFN